MLAGSCRWGIIAKYQKRTPKAASKAFNIREVWKPVFCHSNKTGMIILWSTRSRILLQRIKHFWCKLAEISFFHHNWSKFGWVYDIITWLICTFQKLEYLWNKKRDLKIANSILIIQTTCLCFKMAWIGKMQISS